MGIDVAGVGCRFVTVAVTADALEVGRVVHLLARPAKQLGQRLADDVVDGVHATHALRLHAQAGLAQALVTVDRDLARTIPVGVIPARLPGAAAPVGERVLLHRMHRATLTERDEPTATWARTGTRGSLHEVRS
jgi:hypothetical protein